MVYHIKLARDRRKRKSRIKAMVFFFALLCIALGTILSLKNTSEKNDLSTSLPSQDGAYQSLHSEPKMTSNRELRSNAEDVTSYDDELLLDDDNEHEIAEEKLIPEAQIALDSLLESVEDAKRIAEQFSHTIVLGDNLKDVLELSGVDDGTSQNLIAIYPELKNLKPGQQIYWILDQYNELEYLNWLISEKEERIYERKKENEQFSRKIIEKKSIWKKEVLKGQITNSLKASLKSLGLDNRKINQLSTALQWQVNVSKLRKGDKFAVLVSREYLGDKLTGQGNVEGIHIITNGKSYYAIQADNGRYYNRNGETINKGFARIPLQRQARISSPFNPRRRHPVTGTIRPHKGVDFALPSGTPIIAPADGVVEKVAYQRGGAGHYIVLKHGREYQTIYMHLSKPLVKVGQTIKRGQRIGLSGNTGISTGAHLHYEFHINGRPVNPMTVKLPNTNAGMSSKERKNFLLKAKTIENKLKL